MVLCLSIIFLTEAIASVTSMNATPLDMTTRVQLFQWASTIKIQLSVLV